MPAPKTDGRRLTVVVSAHAPLGGPVASHLARLPATQVVLVGEGTAPGVDRLWAEGPDGLTGALADAVARHGTVHTLVEIPTRLAPGARPPSGREPGRPGAGGDELAGIVDRVDASVPAMAAAGAGRVVFVTEASGIPGRSWDHRRASVMWGLVGLARSGSRDLAASGITFNVVRAGVVETAELVELRRQDPAVEAAVAEAVAATPLRRAVTPDEVGAAVAFLASDAASFVTGAVVPVDGGLTMGSGA